MALCDKTAPVTKPNRRWLPQLVSRIVAQADLLDSEQQIRKSQKETSQNDAGTRLAPDTQLLVSWLTATQHKNHLHHIHTGFKSDFIISKGFSCRFNTVVVVFECSIERKGLIEIPSHSLWNSMSNEQRTFDELDEKIVKLRKTWDWGRVDLNSEDSSPEAFQWNSEKKASISFHVRSPWPASI